MAETFEERRKRRIIEHGDQQQIEKLHDEVEDRRETEHDLERLQRIGKRERKERAARLGQPLNR